MAKQSIDQLPVVDEIMRLNVDLLPLEATSRYLFRFFSPHIMQIHFDGILSAEEEKTLKLSDDEIKDPMLLGFGSAVMGCRKLVHPNNPKIMLQDVVQF